MCVYLATETARKVTKCTIDIKYSESDVALDIYYPPNIKGNLHTILNGFLCIIIYAWAKPMFVIIVIIIHFPG